MFQILTDYRNGTIRHLGIQGNGVQLKDMRRRIRYIAQKGMKHVIHLRIGKHGHKKKPYLCTPDVFAN